MGEIANKKELSKKILREKIRNIRKLVKKFDNNEERSGLIIRKLIDELDELRIEYHLYHAYHVCAEIEKKIESEQSWEEEEWWNTIIF